jgi:hypothetical protein
MSKKLTINDEVSKELDTIVEIQNFRQELLEKEKDIILLKQTRSDIIKRLINNEYNRLTKEWVL